MPDAIHLVLSLVTRLWSLYHMITSSLSLSLKH